MDDTARLLAIEEIKTLKARYFRYVDEKNWDGLVGLFAPDAVFDHSKGGSIHNPWTGEWEPPLPKEPILSVGREAILTRIRAVVENLRTTHQGFMPEIDIIDTKTARGVWAMSDQLYDRSGRLILSGHGYYNETYERRTEGWVIKTIALSRLWIVRGDGQRE